jgi:hypothetical protein
MGTKILTIAFFFFILVKLGYSQEIHIRTVPLAANNQSDFQPSLSRGMGNLSIAFDDPLSDPFTNPAKASKLQGVNLFFSPTRNSWSNEEGSILFSNSGSSKYKGTGINSLPFGLFLKKDNFFAGGLITYQSYSSERSTNDNLWLDLSRNNTEKNDIGDNTYLFGLIGTYFPELKISLAGSISWSDFEAIDGVNLLYPGSSDINQDGWAVNYKFGLTGELSEQDQLDFVVGRSIFKSSHEVIYDNPIWFLADVRPGMSMYRTELNKDESNSWVVHTKYNHNINNKWRVGTVFIVNWKEHPKIPNYSLANIPRDPGNSTAYNIGAGFTYSGERTTIGLEYIYEPISSYTWAEAGEDFVFTSKFKTVENFFDFYNHIFRAGLNSRTEYDWLSFRLGVQLHFNKYNLKQDDNIFRTSRTADENWLETTLCGGLTFKFSNIQMLYSLQVILGNGMVGAEGNGITRTFIEDAVRNDFIIAPYGDLVVDEIPLVTQQISFVYNL